MGKANLGGEARVPVRAVDKRNSNVMAHFPAILTTPQARY